jgi:hypothetical protein
VANCCLLLTVQFFGSNIAWSLKRPHVSLYAHNTDRLQHSVRRSLHSQRQASDCVTCADLLASWVASVVARGRRVLLKTLSVAKSVSDELLWSTGGTTLSGINRCTRRKTCPSATISTTNFTWIGLGMNPGLCCVKPANLGHDTGCSSSEFFI